jgi:hypothetical protein
MTIGLCKRDSEARRMLPQRSYQWHCMHAHDHTHACCAEYLGGGGGMMPSYSFSYPSYSY